MMNGLGADDGQEVVEFALLLPLLLLFLLGIVEFGVAVFTYNTMTNAAREVARYGVIHPNQLEIDQYVDEHLSRWTQGIHGENLQVSSVVETGAIQGSVWVTVTYDYQLISGPIIQVLGGEQALKLVTTSTMRTETFPD